MDSRRQFLIRLAEDAPSRTEQAIALLWYYEQAQIFTERSATDLAGDIQDEGFGEQNVARLRNALKSSRLTVNGTTRGAFRINASRFQELSDKYSHLLDIVEPTPTSSVIPLEYVDGTRTYLVKLVRQINGCYDAGYFDASAVMIRRLVESLLIEIYISQNRQAEIRQGNAFMMLNDLITHITSDAQVTKSRNFVKGLTLAKDIGDTAAHDRTYNTPKQDIDDNTLALRRVVNELLVLAGIRV
jgi:hypothetical protein